MRPYNYDIFDSCHIMLHGRLRGHAALRTLQPGQPPGADVELCLRHQHWIPHVQAIRHARAAGRRALVRPLTHHRFLVHLHLRADDGLHPTLGRDGHLAVEQALGGAAHFGRRGAVQREAESRRNDVNRVGFGGIGVGGRWKRTNR